MPMMLFAYALSAESPAPPLDVARAASTTVRVWAEGSETVTFVPSGVVYVTEPITQIVESNVHAADVRLILAKAILAMIELPPESQ